MRERGDLLKDAEPIVLAREPGFSLGRLWVEPGTRQVVRPDGKSETLEPRVMQVLVALARADGAVVGRDELIALCWDGRIVTDDAINRVLSRVRQVASGIGGDSFAVETIARVGYRLKDKPEGEVVVPFPGPGSAAVAGRRPGRGEVGRRTIVGAGAGALLLAGGGLAWWRPWKKPVNAEARQLVERGNMMMREGLPGQIRQAASYFERATVLDPDNADAWGGLALAYSHQMQGFDEGETASLPGLIRSAAARAQALDPGNGDASLATIFMTPIFGQWADKERKLQEVIARRPRQWLAHGRLGVVRQQVGRFEEALKSHRRALEIEPMLPLSHALIINAMSALGRIQEGDAAAALAGSRWPANPALWMSTWSHLLFTGRPERAISFLLDPARRPSGFPETFADQLLGAARASAGGEPRAVEAAAEQALQAGSKDVSAIPISARLLALLGRDDQMFEQLERYYFEGGKPAATIRRWTDILFLPPLGSFGDDPRMRALRERVGLAAYWRQTGSRPDV